MLSDSAQTASLFFSNPLEGVLSKGLKYEVLYYRRIFACGI